MIGQTASSSGSLGTVSLCCLLFVVTAVYMGIVWGQDMASPRFMWGGFVFNVRQAIEATKSKKTMQYVYIYVCLYTCLYVCVFELCKKTMQCVHDVHDVNRWM